MTIKITRGKEGGRRVKIDMRLSDYSGHVDIIDMLEDYQRKEWSQSQVGHTALMLLLDEWRKNQTYPLSPSAEYVSKEMLDLVKKAQNALDRTNDILKMIASGGIVAGNSSKIQKEIEQLRGDLDLQVIEGAANYAGQVAINDEDDGSGS